MALDVTELSADRIHEWNETLKILVGVTTSLVVGAGTIVSYFINKNTKETKTNTASHSTTAQALADHMDSMNQIKSDAISRMDKFTADLAIKHQELMLELQKMKIVVVRVNQTADQKLSKIPQLEIAVNKYNTEVASIRKDFDETWGELRRRLREVK